MRKIRAILLITIHFGLSAQKVTTEKEAPKKLTYKEYLNLATKSNLLLAAEKYKVSEAEAKIALAKIFPDPQFTLGNASGDITGQNLQQQFYAGITQTLPRGGKYGQGIKVAKAEKDLQLALYEDYLRVFKVDVTKRFINVIIAQMDYEKNVKTSTLLQNELRKKEAAAELKSIELYRLQIEAGQIRDQLYQSENELNEAFYALYIPLSGFAVDTSLDVVGSLDIPLKKFNLDSIIPIAMEQRTDVVMAKKKFALSTEHQTLVKSNRRKDWNIVLGDNYYTKATNYIAPTPSYHAITAMINIPIAFSNLKKQDLKIAELKRQGSQNEMSYIQNLIQLEIYRTYDKYIIAQKQLQIYNGGLIEASDKVLQEELENYKSGKTSFLDLSESHRKLDEVYHSYFQALKTYAYTLVELEDYMGIWDLEFK